MDRTLLVPSQPLLVSADAEQRSDARLPARHLGYRPDVDGLRAIAILAVIGFHAAPRLVPGGFTGVDIFFVISGFLISGIVLRALANDEFSLLDFYARRVRRIFPALAVTLVLAWAFGWLILLPDEQKQLGKQMAAGAGFVLNLFQYTQDSRYFGAVESEPFIHLWSLGVEEQFYLVWPLLLLALWRWGRGALAWLVAVAAISFVANVATVFTDPQASFYLPSGRLWELAAGGVLAHAQLFDRGEPTQLDARLRRVIGFWKRSAAVHARGAIGAILLVGSVTALNSGMAFPGWWALIPCLGALLLIGAGPNSWVNRHVLSHPVLVFIGLISYPLYLVHWPMLAYLDTIEQHEASAGMKLAAVAAAFALAFAIYKYVELPVRSSAAKARIAVGLCATMAVCAVVGYLTSAQDIPARSASFEAGRFTQGTTEDWLPGSNRQWTRFVDGFLTLGDGPRRVLFLGDSNMQQYYPRVAQMLADHPHNSHSAVFAVRAGCAPAVEMTVLDPTACRKLVTAAIDYARDPSVDTVVIASCWYCHFVAFGDLQNFGAAGPLKPGSAAALENLRKMIASLVAQGKRVYVVLNIPVGQQFDPRHMVHRMVFPPTYEVVIPTPARTQILRAIHPIVSRVAQISREAGATVIDPIASLCDRTTCPAVDANGAAMYRDLAHLRASYVRQNVHYLDETTLDSQTPEVAGLSRTAQAASP